MVRAFVCYLKSRAMTKVITGVQLLVAEATVADVSVTLALLKFWPNVLLGITKHMANNFTTIR
jgi:hypothetical protein